MELLTKSARWGILFVAILGLGACARTEIIQSPRTAYVEPSPDAAAPKVIWTSRNLQREFDYLGRIEARSWTYNGVLERLVNGGKSLGADAVIDVHYQRVGFMKTMQAFAIKYK